MIRRNCLKVLGGALAATPFAFNFSWSQERTAQSAKSMNSIGLIKPKVLHEGDAVAVIAPATVVSDPDDIARAEEAAQYYGLKIIFGESLLKGSGYKTRTVEERIKDLHSAFSDKDIKAVFCIRGGYGSGTLLDKINYDLIKRNPKIFAGYSDITAMHLAINKYSNLLTFHGPMMLSTFTEYTDINFKNAMFTTQPLGLLKNPDAKNNFRTKHPIRTIVPGTAKGSLTGGNLSLISSLMGTPYEIETKGKILLIEDVGEEPFRIDRMLNQLRLAGKLQVAAGIVFGNFTDCDYSSPYSSRSWDYSLGESIDNVMKDIPVPAFYGLDFGHTADQLTLPLGLEVELDTSAGTLFFNEPATID